MCTVFVDSENADVDPTDLEPGRTYTLRVVHLTAEQLLTPEPSLSALDAPTTQEPPGAPVRPTTRFAPTDDVS